MVTCFSPSFNNRPYIFFIFSESNKWDGSPEHRGRWKNAYNFNSTTRYQC